MTTNQSNPTRYSFTAHRTTTIRRSARPGGRKIALLIAISACSLGMLSCQPAYIDRMYAVVEVFDSKTGAPVEGAMVSARQVFFEEWEEQSNNPYEIVFAPTDSAGRTWMHVFRAGNKPFEPIIELKIQSGEFTDELSFLLAPGERASGDHFTATIAETDAASVPLPLLTVVDGSQPPRILVKGYVRLIGVCSTSTGRVLWERALRDAQYFHEEIIVGSTADDPQGVDWEQAPNGDTMAEICRIPAAHGPSGQFVVFALPPFENQYYRGQNFCLDESDKVISCDADEMP